MNTVVTDDDDDNGFRVTSEIIDFLWKILKTNLFRSQHSTVLTVVEVLVSVDFCDGIVSIIVVAVDVAFGSTNVIIAIIGKENFVKTVVAIELSQFDRLLSPRRLT